MKPYLFFDWNGTLLNDLSHNFEIVQELLRRAHLPEISLETYLNEFGFPLESFYERIGFDLKKSPFSQITVDFMELYHRDPFPSLFEDAIASLENLKSQGFSLGVLSAYRQDRLRNLVQQFGLEEYFDHILGIENDEARSKAHRLKEFKTQNPEVQEIFLIGDTLHDVEVALEEGAKPLLVDRGHQSAQSLRNQSPETPLFHSLAECNEFLVGI